MNFVSLILISGVLTAGHWFFIFDHGETIIAETERLRQEIIKTDKEVIDKKDKLQKLVAFDNSVKKIGQEVEAFLQYIPAHLNTRIVYEDLIKVAHKSAVEIKNIQNLKPKKETALYETLTIKLNLEGNFSDFLTFLSGLTELNKIMIIQDISLTLSNESNKDTSSKKITANVNLLSFRYILPSAPQDEKS